MIKKIDLKLIKTVKNRKWLYIKYSATSSDVAQCSFSKMRAKQMSFEFG